MLEMDFLEKDLARAKAEFEKAKEDFENKTVIANEAADNVFDITVTFNEFYENGNKAPYKARLGELKIFGEEVTIALSDSKDSIAKIFVKVLEGKIIPTGSTRAYRPAAIKGTKILIENVRKELIEKYSNREIYSISLYPRSEQKRDEIVEKEKKESLKHISRQKNA